MKEGYVYELRSLVKVMPVYFGSAFSMEQRLKKHESSSNRCASLAIIETGSYSMGELERVWVEDRRELDKYEDRWIRENPCVNKQRAFLTDDEKAEKHREKTNDYYAKNPEKYRERVRVWRENNPEKARKANRKWVAANPEKVREHERKRLVKVSCGICANVVAKAALKRHQKSAKCRAAAAQPKLKL